MLPTADTQTDPACGAVQVLARQARAGAHPEVQELRMHFNKLDTNGDGTVDMEELQAALVGSSLTAQQVQVGSKLGLSSHGAPPDCRASCIPTWPVIKACTPLPLGTRQCHAALNFWPLLLPSLPVA